MQRFVTFAILQITLCIRLTFAFAPVIHNTKNTFVNCEVLNTRKHFMVEDANRLEDICKDLNDAISKCQPEFIKTCKVKVAKSTKQHRLGLVATENMKKGDVALAIPYDDQIILTPKSALATFKGILPEGYDGWTGDNGLLALMVLNELAKAATDGNAGIPLPQRKNEASLLINVWIKSFPTPTEMKLLHPILWETDEQEILQSSTTKKIYRTLDDIDEDSNWLDERVWSKDREKFPEQVQLNGETYPCFTAKGFAWAMATVASRVSFVDGTSRMIPIMDVANHDDLGVEEVGSGFMGRFGTTKGAQIRTGKTRQYKKDEEVFVTYGPKSAAEYCLEHGFIPDRLRTMTTSVAEISFEIDPDDKFYDDKLDILEFETYESAPMEPLQSFDVVSEIGRDGEPDPAMIQFLRLAKLGLKDAFLLESIFRKDVWGFMSLPVSEPNERDVLATIASACTSAIEEMEGVDMSYDESKAFNSPSNLCAIVKDSESKALSRTLDFVNREKEASDLKEYYQQRRLKDMGLDSDWNPDETSSMYSNEEDDDLGFGQTRAPGSLDW
jgi:[ribulose-bisphosphate carboxylase]-lysine N-methyltransferase